MSMVKLAQLSRVVLAVCTTMERLPKNEPSPSLVEAYRSRYLIGMSEGGAR